ESIGNLSSLKKLDLSYNELTTLPESIGNLKSLVELDLKLNHLMTLPESIDNLKSLAKLYLSDNQLKTLPESFWDLKSLQILSLANNKFTTLPESIGELSSLHELDLSNNQLTILPESFIDLIKKDVKINLENNSFSKSTINKFKGLSIKTSGLDSSAYIKLASLMEPGMKKRTFKDKLGERFASLRGNLPSLIYAGSIAILGIITFLLLNSYRRYFMPQIFWFTFSIALLTNFIIGISIIAALSGYFKRYVEAGIKILESTDSEKLDEFAFNLRERLYGLFDVFVFFYLVWALRSGVKSLFSLELIPSINIFFEITIPSQVINILILFGYRKDLSFLENLDLFLGHLFLKIFGVVLVFWALYRNGIGYVRKTAFEEEEQKNIKPFLIFGAIGAISLIYAEVFSFKSLLSPGYSFGVVIGCCIFLWEKYKNKPSVFYLYLGLIGIGLFLIWFISLLNYIISLIIVGIFVILFFILRRQGTKQLFWADIIQKLDQSEAIALTELKSLVKEDFLPQNDIDDNSIGFILGKNKIIKINLSNCELTTLPESFWNLKSLLILSLAGNKFTILPEAISNLKSLTKLNLSDNQLTTLPKSIGNLKSLEELDLSYNELTTLPESISNLKSLVYLNLRNNQLRTLPESIGNLKSLVELDLEDNQLRTLPESIGNLKSLVKLDLDNNQLTTLPVSIGNLISLETLRLFNNHLTVLPKSIGNLKSLVRLGLGNNQLRSLPESIGNLKSLQKLDLSYNQLTTLPESIGNLSLLKELYLDKNKLRTLPESIGNLKSLKYLNLENNKLTTLPESILNINSLETIYIAPNPLYERLDHKTRSILEQLKDRRSNYIPLF
ncbi:MAG: leucine-rich repeat domain-containing protein, partial [Promethearchaeota archaeon]